MKKILVIDDADFILESTSTLLMFEGYEVHTAADGEAGVAAAFELKPDMILCDISMPKLDGYGVLERIRTNPETSLTPFIFLTAFTERANMRAGMVGGADDYIMKPFTRDELINAINAQWQKHKLIEKQVQEKVEEVSRNVTYALPHEFRTVINEVLNSAKLLINGAEFISPNEIKETAEDITKSALRLQKITENFLMYIRIQSIESNPEQKRKLRNFYTEEPASVLNDIAELIAHRYNRVQDLLLIGNPEQFSIEVSTESYDKIIEELIDNAFKFSLPGKQVTITSKINENFYCIDIEDKGIGMTENQIASIAALAQFERKILEQQGVGFGLIIAKKLTELHDGSFQIESHINEGTKIYLRLPIKK